jgi:[ribosomal protein S18]-alanine N-acetyltransferase
MNTEVVSSLDEPPSSARVAPAAHTPATCRVATPDDLDELVRLERVAFAKEDWFPRHRFKELIETPDQHAVLVHPAGASRLAGDAILFWRKGSATARLYNIVVDPEFQKGGFGSRLLEYAEDTARRRGCRRLVLEVRANNAQAIAFYQRKGFRHFGTLAAYYPDGTAALRYEKFLNGILAAQLELVLV